MRTQGEAGDAGDQILGNHCHLIAHSTPQVCSVRRKTPSHCSAGVLIDIKPPHLLRISRSSRLNVRIRIDDCDNRQLLPMVEHIKSSI